MRTWSTAIGLGVAAVCGWTAWADGDLLPCANQDYGGRDVAPAREVRPLVGRPETAPAGPNPQVVVLEGDRLTSNTCATAHQVAFDLNARYEDIMVAAGLSFTCPQFGATPTCNSHVQCGCIWYKFNAVYPMVRITTCEDQIMPSQGGAELPDPAIALYRATDPNAPCDSLVEFACSDDDGCLVSAYGPPYDGRGAEVFANGLTFGTTYYVQVCFTAWCDDNGTVCPYAEGDYRLRIYNSDLGCCAVACHPSAAEELELDRCGLGPGRFNDGCDAAAGEYPRFSPIACNQMVCGTSFRSAADYDDFDRDWYRLVLPPGGPYTINWTVRASFNVKYGIIPAGTGPWGCDDLPAPLDVVEDFQCNVGALSATATVDGGVYFLTVEPDQVVACGGGKASYEATLTTTPCIPPTGACCAGAACTDQTLAACNAAGGSYYGDGSTCVTTACYACPPGAVLEGEPGCSFPHDINPGCVAGAAEPVLSPLACGQTVCGSSGTWLTDINERDNDYYYLNLPDGSASLVMVEALAQFPMEVVLIDQGDFQNPCATFQAGFKVATAVPAGQPLTASYCFLNQPTPLYGDAWILARPYKVGPPSELLCADVMHRNKYWLKVTCSPCTVPPTCRGDANCDGARTFKDIDAFVARLGCPTSNPASCVAPAGCTWEQADMNADGIVNFKDISGFVAQLGIACP